MKTIYQIAVVRLENNRADTSFSRAGIPRQGLKPGWNLEEAPRVSHETAPELSPASRARMARLSRQSAPVLAPCKEIPVTLAQGKDKVIFLPTGKFKTLKKSCELREIKRRVEIWSRAVTLGTTVYHFSSRAKAVTLTTGTTARRDYSKVNDAELRAPKLRRTPEQVKQAFARILPERADELARHLFRL
ncbi:MAG: hypothetical protein V4819_16460 [Verrucomicrobiota bacterium]